MVQNCCRCVKKSESPYRCTIPVNFLLRSFQIWNCRGCFCMFHITCIQKWVKDGVYQQTAHLDHVGENTKVDLNWNWSVFCIRMYMCKNDCKDKKYKYLAWLTPIPVLILKYLSNITNISYRGYLGVCSLTDSLRNG